MKPQKLAHAMVWSVGLFTLAYLLQQPFMAALGVRQTATLLFVLLVVSGAFAGISIRVMYTHELKGLVAYGLISMFLTIILVLTRYQFVGIFLFVLYSGVAIARLFKIAQAERHAAVAAKNAKPPADLPL
jgi:hypothetical protein